MKCTVYYTYGCVKVNGIFALNSAAYRCPFLLLNLLVHPSSRPPPHTLYEFRGPLLLILLASRAGMQILYDDQGDMDLTRTQDQATIQGVNYKQTSQMSEKLFIYLVQSETGLPDHYWQIENQNADLLCLTWKSAVDGYIFYPHSSWTEGRNLLLQEAKKKGAYRYYIFLDDDISFKEGSFRVMEEHLIQYEPAVATPFYSPHPNPCLEQDVHTTYSFDAMYNAFHSDLIEDGIVLPYYDGFDHKTWWFSQLCLIHLSSVLYPNHVLKFNKIKIENLAHRDYPRNDKSEFAELEEWIKQNVFNDSRIFRENFRSHLKIKAEETYRSPYPKLSSYRIAPHVRDSILNVTSIYWKRIEQIKKSS